MVGKAPPIKISTPIKIFLMQHDVGKLLLKRAKDVVSDSMGQIAIDEKDAAIRLRITNIGKLVVEERVPDNLAKEVKQCLREIEELAKLKSTDKGTMEKLAGILGGNLTEVVAERVAERSVTKLSTASDEVRSWLFKSESTLKEAGVNASHMEPEGYDVTESLTDFPKEALLDMKNMETVCRELHHFMSYVAAKCRPTGDSPPLRAPMGKTALDTQIFNGMPAALTESIETMTREVPKILHKVLHQVPFVMKELVQPFETFVAARDTEFMTLVSGRLTANPSGLVGADLTEIKSAARSLPAFVHGEYGAVIGIMVEMEALNVVLWC